MKFINKYLMLMFLLATMMTVVWFRHGNVLGTGESGLPFEDIGRLQEVNEKAWSDAGLGTAVAMNTAVIPAAKVWIFFQELGVSGVALEAATFWLLFVVAGIAIWLLTRSFFPKMKPYFLFMAVLFYWFNPISLVNIWNRFLYNYMFFWAMLPLTFYLFIKGIQKKDYKFALLFSFVTLIFSYSLSSIVFNMLLFFLLGFTVVFWWLSNRDRRTGFLVKYLALALVSFLTFNFWWIGQLLEFLTSNVYSIATSAFFSSQGNLDALSATSQRLGWLLNNIRLMHGTFYYYSGPEWARIFSYFPFSAVGFVFPIIIFLTIFRNLKNKSVLFWAVLFTLGLFLAKGNMEPLGLVFQWAFTHIPSFQVFRNPFEKFSFILALAATPLVAYGLSRYSNKLVSFILIAVFLGFPFWTGLVLTSIEGTGELHTYEVKVPEYYDKVADWLTAREGDFRFISLPLGGEAIEYTWEKPYVGVELSGQLFGTPNISYNSTIPFYHDVVNGLTGYQLGEKLFNFVPSLNAKYLVVRSDIDYRSRRMPGAELVRARISEMVEKGFISEVFIEGELAVYEIAPQYFWPKIYSANQIIFANNTDLANINMFANDFPIEKNVILPLDERNKHLFSSENVLVLAPAREYSPIVPGIQSSFSDQELIDNLLFVKHSPKERLFPLYVLKEEFESPRKSDISKYTEYQIGLLGKRAVELYNLTKEGANETLINAAERRYAKYLDRIKSLNGIDATSLQSFLCQYELLKRIDSDVLTKAEDHIQSLYLKPVFDLPHKEDGQEYLIYQFEVPFEGEYTLEFDETLKKSIRVYIDGGLQISSSQYTFSEGFHELAFLMNNTDLAVIVFQEKDLTISNHDRFLREISIEGGKSYVLNVYHRFTEGNSFKLTAVQDIDEERNPLLSDVIRKHAYFHDGLDYKASLTTNVGADRLGVKIEDVPETECFGPTILFMRCKPKQEGYRMDVWNFSLEEKVNPTIRLVANRSVGVGKGETLSTFEKVDPTEYKVRVVKESGEREILVFSELFHSDWKAFVGTELLQTDLHLLVNGYANGWVLEKPGEYDITIKFTPDSTLEKGKKISFIAMMVGIVTLAVLVRRRNA